MQSHTQVESAISNQRSRAVTQASSLASHLARAGLAVIVLTACLAQSGCLTVAATGVAMGAMAVTDRRTIGTQTDDQAIEFKALTKIQQGLKSPGGVSVTSYNRHALITGQVLDEASKVQAARIVAEIDGVRVIHNELTVSGRASLGTNASDSVLTTKIRAYLLEAKEIQSNAVKVVTEASTAYLMGVVNKSEADRIAQVVSRVGGVEKVVTVFEILSDDEISRLQNLRK